MANLIEYWNSLTPDPEQGGYSDIRLWPCYMLFSGLILFLAPLIGMASSFIIVGVPALIIAIKVSAKQNSDPVKAAQAWKEIDELYRSIEARDKKTRSAHKPAIATKTKPNTPKNKDLSNLVPDYIT